MRKFKSLSTSTRTSTRYCANGMVRTTITERSGNTSSRMTFGGGRKARFTTSFRSGSGTTSFSRCY